MFIGEKVAVGLVNNIPKYVIWKGRNYTIGKVGLHHTYNEGKTLFHIFSVVAGSVFLRLKLDSESLLWTLEDISDV